MYDARIGRWLSTDPKGQFASPYEGMGNDPVTGSDPTGGDVTDWYKNVATGALFWQAGNAATVTGDDGLVYDNVGRMTNWAQDIKATDGTKIYEHWHGGPDGQRLMTGYTESKDAPDGVVNSVSFGATVIIGASIEIGHVSDWRGNGRWFMSISGNIGIGTGGGFNHRTIKSNPGNDFKVGDYANGSSSYSGGIGPINYTHGGNNASSGPGSAEFNPLKQGATYTESGLTATGAILKPENVLTSFSHESIGIMFSSTNTTLSNKDY